MQPLVSPPETGLASQNDQSAFGGIAHDAEFPPGSLQMGIVACASAFQQSGGSHVFGQLPPADFLSSETKFTVRLIPIAGHPVRLF